MKNVEMIEMSEGSPLQDISEARRGKEIFSNGIFRRV
jgi:hypothetical protein